MEREAASQPAYGMFRLIATKQSQAECGDKCAQIAGEVHNGYDLCLVGWKKSQKTRIADQSSKIISNFGIYGNKN